MCIQGSALTHVTLLMPKTCLSIMLNYQWNTRIDMSLTKLHQSLALINSSYHSSAHLFVKVISSPNLYPLSIWFQTSVNILFRPLWIKASSCRPLLTHSDWNSFAIHFFLHNSRHSSLYKYSMHHHIIKVYNIAGIIIVEYHQHGTSYKCTTVCITVNVKMLLYVCHWLRLCM